ncbi:MAG: VOC family protein [Calditrichaeota bacterium]|nr:VOC family protein [Calditrichota bacterium]
MSKINTYLNFPGTAEAAFEFYKAAFGGEFSVVVRFKDFPMPGVTIPPADGDKIMHIGLPIGSKGDVLMASDNLESLGQKLVFGNNSYVSVHPESREEADRLWAALTAGGEIEMPIADQPWGDYWGAYRDRFGVKWMIDYAPPRQ